jgi:hypothetical protein
MSLTVRTLFLLISCLLATSVTGCVAVDSVDDRVDAVNRDINDARNHAILLNIARASYGHPLNFVSITSIGGSGSVGAGLGLPSFALGTSLSEAQRQYAFSGNSLNGSITTNFNINPIESKEFYTGLLTPLDMRTALFFLAQGFPRELVFYLFVDGLTIHTSKGTIVVPNDPANPEYPRFVDYMHRSVDYGLTLESYGGGKDVRLCFDATLASKPLGKLSPLCRSEKDENGIRNFVEGASGHVDIDLKLRSTYEIFQYLGHLSNADAEHNVHLISPELRRGGGAPPLLFPIRTSANGGRCLTSVLYSGRYFCVPSDKNQTSGRVIDLLTILVALNSSVRDLPAIPAIQVTQ